MNTLRIIAVFSLGLAPFLLRQQTCQAALPIDLEVATQQRAPIMAQQEWSRVLGQMNLGTVRLRGARPGDRPLVKAKKTGNSTRYRVVGILNQRNQLILPERKFALHETQALKKHFAKLPAQTDYMAEDRGRFGLTEKQFRQVFAEFSVPVGASTVGKTAEELLTHLEKTLNIPVKKTRTAFPRNGKPLAIELKEFSTGTALAYALRREGLAVWPEQLPGQGLQLSIEPYHEREESWPIGWKPAVSGRKSAPQLYKFRDIEIEGFTLEQALTALQPAIKVPVLLDDWLLAQRSIDLTKIEVSVKKKRRSLKSAVDRILSQGKLAVEIRVDEQDKPFLWVTQFGKNSPRAVK